MFNLILNRLMLMGIGDSMKYPLVITNEKDRVKDSRQREMDLVVVAIITLDDKSVDSRPIEDFFNDQVEAWNHTKKIAYLVIENKRSQMQMDDWKKFYEDISTLRNAFKRRVATEMREKFACEVCWDFDMCDGRDVY